MSDSMDPGYAKAGIEAAQRCVRQFYEKVLPKDVTAEQQLLKLGEEFGELCKGLHKRNQVAIADGLTDCLYVILGIANLRGIPLGPLFVEVHQANMRKTRDGTLSPRGKDYVDPSIAELLE